MEALLEFLNAAEAGIAAAKRVIAEAKGVETWNADKIAVHDGKITREGYFYWVFQNGSTVGRKKRK